MLKHLILYMLLLMPMLAMAQQDRDLIRSGNKFYRQKKYSAAEVDYRKAISKNPENPQALYNLGCAYLKAGDLKKAKYAFIRAIELKNNIADFHYNLAFVYKKLGKEKQAKTYLENYNKLTGQI